MHTFATIVVTTCLVASAMADQWATKTTLKSGAQTNFVTYGGNNKCKPEFNGNNEITNYQSMECTSATAVTVRTFAKNDPACASPTDSDTRTVPFEDTDAKIECAEILDSAKSYMEYDYTQASSTNCANSACGAKEFMTEVCTVFANTGLVYNGVTYKSVKSEIAGAGLFVNLYTTNDCSGTKTPSRNNALACSDTSGKSETCDNDVTPVQSTYVMVAKDAAAGSGASVVAPTFISVFALTVAAIILA